MSTSSEPTDMAYGRAITRGVYLGWLVMPLITLVIVVLGVPSSSWAARLAIAAVVGFWVGLFFGGVTSVAVFMIGYERRAAAERLAARQPEEQRMLQDVPNADDAQQRDAAHKAGEPAAA